MEQICPRCNSAQVTKIATNGIKAGGLFVFLISQAIVGYKCPKCGVIPLNEFSDDFQASVKRKRIMFIVGALLLLLAVLAILMYFKI